MSIGQTGLSEDIESGGAQLGELRRVARFLTGEELRQLRLGVGRRASEGRGCAAHFYAASL